MTVLISNWKPIQISCYDKFLCGYRFIFEPTMSLKLIQIYYKQFKFLGILPITCIWFDLIRFNKRPLLLYVPQMYLVSCLIISCLILVKIMMSFHYIKILYLLTSHNNVKNSDLVFAEQVFLEGVVEL